MTALLSRLASVMQPADAVWLPRLAARFAVIAAEAANDKAPPPAGWNTGENRR